MRSHPRNSYGLWTDWVLGTLLALAVAAAYAPVVPAGYVWDDDEYVVENPNLNDVDGLRRIWLQPRSSPQYYPLVFTSFWIERQFSGVDPHVSHVVNCVLHVANAILVWRVLLRLGIGGAYVAALIFAIHPVHVESVAWITERKNVLSGFFALLSLITYLRATQSLPGSPLLAAARGRWYAASLALFVAALLSKTVTGMLPAVIVILIWWKRGRIEMSHALPLAPFLTVGAAAGLVTAWLEVVHVGATGGDWSLSPAERLLVAGRAVWFYVGKLLWPHPIVFVYPRWEIDASLAWQWSYPVAALALTGALWYLRHRIGRGALAAWLCFVALLFPALGFLNVYPMRYSFVADHFQYLASIAVFAAIASACDRWLQGSGWNAWRLAAPLLVVGGLIPITRAETAKYANLEALWGDTIAKDPASWIAHNNLGTFLLREGRVAKARESFEHAVRARPEFAEAHNNLGTAWFREGDTTRAQWHHRRAVELSPRYAEAHNNVGVDLMTAGRIDEAIASYRRALEIDPSYSMARYNLARALVRKEAFVEADAHYAEVIRLNPLSAQAHYDLGMSRLAQGRPDEATASLNAALRIDPRFYVAYYDLGNLFLRSGDPAAAAVEYRRALAIAPDYAEARANLGSALMRQGQVVEAVAEYREALRLKPDYAIAANNLGYALEQLGHVAEARRWYAEAVRLDPADQRAGENLRRLR